MHQDRVIRLHVPPDLSERIEEKRLRLNPSLQEIAIGSSSRAETKSSSICR
jgi:hypothetical protein